MSGLLRKLFKNVAGLRASMLAAAAVAAPEPTTAGILLGLASVLLMAQSWSESLDDEDASGVADTLRELAEKHGTLEEAVASLAAGTESHELIGRDRATEVLNLLRASEDDLQRLHDEHNSAVIYAANFLAEQQKQFGERFEQALRDLENGVNSSLGRIEGKIDTLQDTASVTQSTVAHIAAEVAKVRKSIPSRRSRRRIKSRPSTNAELDAALMAYVDDLKTEFGFIDYRGIAGLQRLPSAARFHLYDAYVPPYLQQETDATKAAERERALLTQLASPPNTPERRASLQAEYAAITHDHWRLHWDTKASSLSVGDAVAGDRHIVILGGPGSGKTLLTRYVPTRAPSAERQWRSASAGMNR